MTQGAFISLSSERLDTADVLRLYDEAAPLLRTFGARLLGPGADLDDFVHDVFVVACRKRGELHRDFALPFLYGTAIRVAASIRRRAQIRCLLGLQPPPDATDLRTPERRLQQRDASRILYSILDTLPQKQRVVFILHEMQGMTAHEIAEIVGCPANTVFSRLRKARLHFLERLEPYRDALDVDTEGPR